MTMDDKKLEELLRTSNELAERLVKVQREIAEHLKHVHREVVSPPTVPVAKEKKSKGEGD